MKAIRKLKKAGMGDEVKWGELGKWGVEMCLNVGECEKATRETSLPLGCALPIGYLPLDHQIPSLEHNLSGDYISALIKLHYLAWERIYVWFCKKDQ